MSLIERRLIATAVLTVLMMSTRLWAEPPTVESLVSGVPVLSPENRLLNRFRFTLETPLPFEVPLVATLVWERPDVFGMIVSAGEEQAPFWFLSHNKSMMFDVTTGEAILGDDAAPQCLVQLNDHKFTIKYSLTNRKNTEVTLDLPSFLDDAVMNGALDQTENGDWRLTVRSRSGKSQLIAEFDKSEPFAIRSLAIRSAVDGTLAFSIRDISINDEKDTAWPAFPPAASFPETLTLIFSKDIEVQAPADGFDVVTHGMRTLMAQGALRNPKWRTAPFLHQVDWTNARNNNAEFGPKLRELLDGRGNEQSDARETSTPSVPKSESTPRSP